MDGDGNNDGSGDGNNDRTEQNNLENLVIDYCYLDCWGLYAGHDFHIWYHTVDGRTVA